MAFSYKLATLFIDILVRNSTANTNINNTRNSIGRLTAMAASIYVLKVAFDVLSAGIASVFKATADLEANFGIIQRTTGMTSEELEDFKEKLLAASTALKGVGITEFQKSVQAASQLGFVGDELLQFATVASKLSSVSTDLGLEEAARAMGVFLNVFGEGTDRASELAGALLRVSNVSNATSGEIINISERLAGYAKTIGLTAEQTFALAAATKDAGVKNEVAASTFIALFRTMTSEPAEVARIIGLTGKALTDFTNDVDTNPIDAIMTFFKQLNQMSPAQVSTILKELKVGDVRQLPTLQSLARIYENIQRNLDIVGDSQANLTKLNDDAANKAEELSSKLNDLIESWTRLKATIGESAPFGFALESLTTAVTGVESLIQQMSTLEGLVATLLALQRGESPFNAQPIFPQAYKDPNTGKKEQEAKVAAAKAQAEAEKKISDEKNQQFRADQRAEKAAEEREKELEKVDKHYEEWLDAEERILALREQALGFIAGGTGLSGIVGQLVQAQQLIDSLREDGLLTNDLMGLIKGQINPNKVQKIEFSDPTALWKKQTEVQKEDPKAKEVLAYLKTIAQELLPDLVDSVNNIDVNAVGP